MYLLTGEGTLFFCVSNKREKKCGEQSAMGELSKKKKGTHRTNKMLTNQSRVKSSDYNTYCNFLN